MTESNPGLHRQVYRNERGALRRHWTPDPSGRRKDIVNNGRPILVDGRVQIADDVELNPVSHGAWVILRRETGQTWRYSVNPERNWLLIEAVDLARRIRSGFKSLTGKIGNAFFIDDYMRY